MVEAEIAHAVSELWRLDRAVYSEVPIVLDGQERIIDLVGLADNNLAACECAERLTHRVIEQAALVRPHANQVWIAISEPLTRVQTHDARRGLLERMGIGLYYVQTWRVNEKLCDKINTTIIAQDMPARTGLLKNALIVDQQGVPAGVPSPQRIRPDQWDKARELLRGIAPDGLTAKALGVALAWSPVDRHEWLRLCRRGEMRGIRSDRTYPETFYAEETAHDHSR